MNADAGDNPGRMRRLVAADGVTMLIAAATTLAVQLGVFWSVRAASVPLAKATYAALALGAVWSAVGAAAMAASTTSTLGSWMRAGVLIDSSIVLLIVLAATSDKVTALAAVKVYCIYASLGAAATAAVICGRSLTARRALATVAATVLVVMMATPLWVGGIINAFPNSSWPRTLAVQTNPVYCIWAVKPVYYTWLRSGRMYNDGISPLQEAGLPPSVWYGPVVTYLSAAAVLVGLGVLLRWVRHRRHRPVSSEACPVAPQTPAPPPRDG